MQLRRSLPLFGAVCMGACRGYPLPMWASSLLVECSAWHTATCIWRSHLHRGPPPPFVGAGIHGRGVWLQHSSSMFLVGGPTCGSGSGGRGGEGDASARFSFSLSQVQSRNDARHQSTPLRWLARALSRCVRHLEHEGLCCERQPLPPCGTLAAAHALSTREREADTPCPAPPSARAGVHECFVFPRVPSPAHVRVHGLFCMSACACMKVRIRGTGSSGKAARLVCVRGPRLATDSRLRTGADKRIPTVSLIQSITMAGEQVWTRCDIHPVL